MRLVFGAGSPLPRRPSPPLRLASRTPGKPSLRRRRPNVGRRCRLRRAQGARRLNWPRVRLLFLGHGSPPPVVNNNTTGCWLAILDRELLWLIADWLVTMHIADSSPPITGGDVV